MPDNRARGLDVSSWQDPAKMRYGDWRGVPGLSFAFYRAGIGTLPDTQATAHGDALRAADYLTGAYWALHEAVSLKEQAARFLAALHPDDCLPPALDVERAALTRAMVLAYLDEWKRLAGPPLTLYTSKQSWEGIMGTAPLPADLRGMFTLGWFAAYPFDVGAGVPVPMDAASVARRSTPPVDRTPPVPAGWAWDIYQHSGQGSLPGYDRLIDLNVYNGTQAQLRARFDAPREKVKVQYTFVLPDSVNTGVVLGKLRAAFGGDLMVASVVVPFDLSTGSPSPVFPPVPPLHLDPPLPVLPAIPSGVNHQWLVNLFHRAFGPNEYIAKLTLATDEAKVFANRAAIYAGPFVVAALPGLTAADKDKLYVELAKLG